MPAALAAPEIVRAQMNISRAPFVAGLLKPAAGGGSCATASFTSTNSSADTIPPAAAGYLWSANEWTASESATICAGALYLRRTGSPTGTIQLAIYDNTGATTKPGALIGTASGTVAVGTVGTTFALVSFTGMSASVTSGTNYYTVMKLSVDGTAGNQIEWGGTFHASRRDWVSSDSGSTWASWQGTEAYGFVLYKS